MKKARRRKARTWTAWAFAFTSPRDLPYIWATEKDAAEVGKAIRVRITEILPAPKKRSRRT